MINIDDISIELGPHAKQLLDHANVYLEDREKHYKMMGMAMPEYVREIMFTAVTNEMRRDPAIFFHIHMGMDMPKKTDG